jgi:hypothetical protein
MSGDSRFFKSANSAWLKLEIGGLAEFREYMNEKHNPRKVNNKNLPIGVRMHSFAVAQCAWWPLHHKAD